MLKIKMSEKYEKDLKEMVKIYEDKIEVLSNSVKDLSDQNDRLRHNY
jgi:mRNA-degrading endonuclease YafQ of YafQ-DinJ toxin-antitoxin module